MTETSENFAAKAIKLASERTETTRKILRRNRLAYLGLHGMAFEQAKVGGEKLRSDREAFFKDLVAKGEEMEAGAVKLFKGTKDKVEDIADDLSGAAEDTRERLWKLLPGAKVNRVEELEAELDAIKKKLKPASTKAKKAAPAKAKKAAKKIVKTAKAATKPVAAAAEKTATKTEELAATEKTAAPKAEATPEVKAAPKAEATPTVKAAPQKREQPRHIPYFNDVKRYDPLANEDVVRAIVKHCGIALQSKDASYVACSDETERQLVRESWYKRKLGVEATDAEIEKKVQNVCSIMQRDNNKNRVTFYYLAAKAERKLEAI